MFTIGSATSGDPIFHMIVYRKTVTGDMMRQKVRENKQVPTLDDLTRRRLYKKTVWD